MVLICQALQVYAGFGNPHEARKYIRQRYGKPCDCLGGYVTSLPNTYISAVSCSAYTAYLSSDSLKWRCVSTPRIFSGGDTTTCPCDTFETAMHSSCYTTYLECTSGGKTYYTAILTRSRTPTIGANSVPTVVGSTNNLISAGCTGTVGQPVCWNIHPPLHTSDGGGPQDKVREIRVYKKLEELQRSLYPEIHYHPLALPKARGKEKVDAQTFALLTATHNLLNNSNSSLANDCWLCLQSGDPVPLAIPSNDLNYTSNTPCTIIPPLKVQPLEFPSSSCIYSPPLNNTYDLDVGFNQFNNCSTIVNIFQSLCAPNSSVFICGNNRAYTYLPTNWTGRCVLATLLPDIDIIPGDEPVPIPAIDHFLGRNKRAIQFIPLLAGLGITTAVATGATGLGVSVTQYTKLSRQLISDMQAISSTIQDLQDQVDSLAEVVLQNRRGLDLLTAEQGGICLALQEKCCFYANKSGIVRDKIRRLQEDLEKRRKEITDNPFWTGFHGLLPYLMPFLGPLLCLLLLLSVGPLVFNKLMTFIKQQVEAIQAKPIQVHYHRLEQEDRGGSYSHPL